MNKKALLAVVIFWIGVAIFCGLDPALQGVLFTYFCIGGAILGLSFLVYTIVAACGLGE